MDGFLFVAPVRSCYKVVTDGSGDERMNLSFEQQATHDYDDDDGFHQRHHHDRSIMYIYIYVCI